MQKQRFGAVFYCSVRASPGGQPPRISVSAPAAAAHDFPDRQNKTVFLRMLCPAAGGGDWQPPGLTAQRRKMSVL